MSRIYTCADQLIGRTPMLELVRLEEKLGLKASILAKLEYLNPAGSAKDRAAREMLDDAERRGILKKGSTVIEPTSGNTGIGLAMLAAIRGYRMIIVMPENMSEERKKLMRAYGAELILTEASRGMKGAIEKAEEIAARTSGAWIAGQFTNPANKEAHFKTTGPEIYADTDGDVDIFVAGIGTGGTITGVGAYLRSVKPQVQIIGVEPAGSPVLSGGKAGPHKIQGIGGGFVPEVLDPSIYDEIIQVPDEAALETGRMLPKVEGILVGISSGAALWAAIRLAQRPENAGKKIVVFFPDTGDRYLSTEMFS